MHLSPPLAVAGAFLFSVLATIPAARAAERTVTDGTGRQVQVPDDPRRIVVMHEPLIGIALLDLGVEVAGSYGRSDDGRVLTAVDFIDTVLGAKGRRPQGIGAFGQLDLEKLRALKPDLIIGTERDAEKAAQLSAIAPVYLQNASAGSASGISVEADLARLLNRQAVFDARKAAYLDRVEAIRARLPKDPKGQTYLAVIVHDQINLVGDVSGAIQALEDLGYRPAKLDQVGSGNGLGTMFAMPLDPERFGRANPDLLVVMNSYVDKDRSAAGIRARLDRIMPGWERFLKPAREGRVLFLDSARVATPSIASAEHTLDAYAAWAKP
ncbi:ABC transporter substrate-binding protein [Xanthobacter sp. AM11]|uniref:ABC transporter substrate-binding protein n=1 Tax=Xanthobacter sp. AM11 TaxID=3380643 RepID=UPI0039BEF307